MVDKPQYSHRNGETEPPAITGVFGFRGTYMDAHENGFPSGEFYGVVSLYKPDTEQWPEFIAYSCEISEGRWRKGADFLGQWWGPVTGPWNEVDDGR